MEQRNATSAGRKRALFFRAGIAATLSMLTLTSCSGGLPAADMKDEPLASPLPVNRQPVHLAVHDYAVGIKADGTVWTWGRQSMHDRALGRAVAGRDDGFIPGPVEGLRDAVSVDTGSGTTLVLTRDGAVWGWGDNDHGQLDPELSRVATKKTKREGLGLTRVAGLPKMTAIVQAGAMSAGLDENGVIWAWGGGGRNTLFDVDGGVPDHRPPTPVTGLPRIVKFSSSGTAIAAIDEAGRLWTVGIRMETGRLQDKDVPASSLVGQVRLPAKVVDVDLGAPLTGIALLENGQVWSWGINSAGQLGLGHRRTVLAPTRIASLSRIRAIKARGEHVLALSEAGDLLYWGALYHKAGAGLHLHEIARHDYTEPVVLQRGTKAVALFSSYSAFGYIDDRGAAWFFGANRDGERGTGRAGEDYDRDFVLTPEKSFWSR